MLLFTHTFQGVSHKLALIQLFDELHQDKESSLWYLTDPERSLSQCTCEIVSMSELCRPLVFVKEDNKRWLLSLRM